MAVNNNKVTRVLYVAASPERIAGEPLDRVSAIEEFTTLQRALDRVPGIELRPLFGATATTLHNELIRGEFDIVHLVSHGHEAGAVLEAERSPYGDVLARELLELLLRQHESLRCVVLNACYSASWFPATLGPALVVMRGEVGDAAALAFSEGFYTSVAADKALPKAFEDGKTRVALHPTGGPVDPHYLPDCRGVIGIRTHETYFQELRDRCLFFCDLGEHFADTRPADWAGAEQALRTFLTSPELSAELGKSGDRMINLDCPGTLALLAGRLVGPQATMAIFHRVGRSMRELWQPDYRKPPPTTSPWVDTPEGDPNAGKLVVSVSVANDVRGDVRCDLTRRGELYWWVDFSPTQGSHQHSVSDADHANALARSLAREIQQLQLRAKVDCVHLYVSVPNAILFLLGQQGVTLSRLQIYEFNPRTREYSPTLLIE